MNVRQTASLRRLARRLPVTSAYERRLQELHAALAEREASIDELRGSVEELRGSLAALEGDRQWVPSGHFYSPFADLAEVTARDEEIFGRDPLDVPGVDLRLADQQALLDSLEPLVADLEWPRTEADAKAAGRRYWTDNPAYADGDALFLTAMLRHLRPKRMVELGCGFSSACTLDTRDELGVDSLELVFVDPYPQLLETLIRPEDRASTTVIEARADQLDPAVLGSLSAGDVLFIDSTHVAKPGSDVNRHFFETLPSLAPGVIVHLHDIFPAFEYPREWVFEGRGWNELYVLRAFLQYNREFRVLLWPSLLHAVDRAGMERRFPPMARNAGGAIWLQRAD